MGRGPQKKKVDPTIRKARAALRRVFDDIYENDFHREGKAMAEALGESPSTISEIVGDTKEITERIGIKLADFKKISLDEAFGRRAVRQVFKPERYPNLAKAIERERDELPPSARDEAIERCQSIAMSYPTDRTVGEWVDELHSVARSIRRAQKTGDGIEGRPLEHDDDTPPAGRI